MIKTRRIRTIIAVASICCLFGFVGCSPDQPNKLRLQGQLTTVGQGPLPKGATARISVVQHKSDHKGTVIIAERTLHDLGNWPINFTLVVRRQLLKPNGQYALNARILDKAGNTRWETRVPQAVVLSQKIQSVTLMLQPHPRHTAGHFRHYRCADDFKFDMALSKRQATLRMGNRQISLQARLRGSAQGTVYADKHDNQLTFGHEKITLAIDGATHMNCQVIKAQNDTSQA